MLSFQMPKPSFMSFYGEKKAEFEKEKPDLTPAELTKYAMNKFRELYSGKSNASDVDASGKDGTNQSNGPNAKRKINTEENERSGIAKLARFSFTKQ